MIFSEKMMQLLGMGIVESLYMTLVSAAVAYILGLPLGLILVATDKDGIKPMPRFNSILGIMVNILRSIPFLILAIFISPLTKAIAGKSYGSTAMIVPLVVSAFPYIARLVESSIKEVDRGVIEAAQSMGASTKQIIMKVLLPEAVPSLLVGATIATTTILGYSAMAGFIGGGGLGAIWINYGYSRYEDDVMTVTVILLVIVMQLLQEIGMRIANKSNKR